MMKSGINDRGVDQEHFINTLKRNNLKLTPQRLMIYRELSKSGEHPSAEKLYRAARKIFPNISFDTVNRTLLTFSRVGIIKVVEGYGSPRRFDPNLKEHHHFRCLSCNRITDLYNPVYDRLEIPPDLSKRYRVLSKKVLLEGFCAGCQGS
jgi:Fur family peroxide stress response transcriptional regulator